MGASHLWIKYCQMFELHHYKRGVLCLPYHENMHILIVLVFNDTSTLVGQFVSSPREREERYKIDSIGDQREVQERKRTMNKSEETEEIKTSPLYPYPLQR